MEYTFIYSAAGETIGFAHGRGIFDLSGHRVGQLKGTHVHAIRGAYVGELCDGRVVDKQLGDFGNIGSFVRGQKNTRPSMESALNASSNLCRSNSTSSATTIVGIQYPLTVPEGSGFIVNGRSCRWLA